MNQTLAVLEDLMARAGGQAEILVEREPEGRYVVPYANRHAASYFGMVRVDPGQEPIPFEDLPSDLGCYLREAIGKAFQNPPPELPLFDTVGPEPHHLSALMVVQRGDNGKQNWFYFTFNDVTPWTALQEEVMNARRMESVGALAGGVAHDFNNLIMAINGHAESIAQDKVNSDVKFSAEAILKACASGTALTRSLLGYTRKQSLQMAVFDLRDLVADLVRLVSRSYGAAYTVETGPGLDPEAEAETRPLIYGCYSALSHVLLNLLNNARDAMPEGGRIRLDAVVERGKVRLMVGDEGCGIAPEHINRIFHPLFTTKEAGQGSGLGLSMVKGVMEQHGAHVGVVSELGKGSTFTLSWPLHTEEEAGETPEAAEGKPAEAGGTPAVVAKMAFIVDDEPMVSAAIDLMLKKQGYRTSVFDAPGPALMSLARPPFPAIVFVDYTMPEMDGVEFIRSFHALLAGDARRQRETLIVLMSGYPPTQLQDMLKEFRGLRIEALQKPFSQQTVNKLLATPANRKFLRKITSRLKVETQKKPAD